MQQATLTHDFTGKLVTGVTTVSAVEISVQELSFEEHPSVPGVVSTHRLVRPAVPVDQFDVEQFLAA